MHYYLLLFDRCVDLRCRPKFEINLISPFLKSTHLLTIFFNHRQVFPARGGLQVGGGHDAQLSDRAHFGGGGQEGRGGGEGGERVGLQ